MKLPPLISARFFEVVARYQGINTAAKELCVTPGAVSQQIRKLEEYCKVSLFYRTAKGLQLTEKGREYYQHLRTAFEIIEQATLKLNSEKQPILISCTPSFAIQWFVPRLQEFLKNNPQIEVHINATNRLINLVETETHFAIRHGLGHYDGLKSEVILNDELIPICSPKICRENHFDLNDITSELLLHDEHRGDWHLWIEATHAKTIDPDKGIVFKDSNAVIEASLAGLGFGLVRRSLIKKELEQGALLTIPNLTIATQLAYHLVYLPNTLDSYNARVFYDWLIQQRDG